MTQETQLDPIPLSFLQVRALLVAASRELSWGLVEVRRDARKWRQLAECIPDQPIREDALTSLDRKRGNVVGAALFSTLTRSRNRDLLRTLASFQTIFDFLDNVNERHPVEANGLQLHEALVDALDPDRPRSEYYRHHPWHDDGGYLTQLVEHCRSTCRAMPSYERVRPLLVREAKRAQHVLSLNHLPDPGERDLALQKWVAEEFTEAAEWHWYELAAAASGQLAIFALLALAAEPDLGERHVAETYDVYWPRLPLVATMLDSYVDQAEDTTSGDHLYVAHYPDSDRLVARVTELISDAARQVLGLPNGHSHAVVMSCMVTFYLSKNSARTVEMKSTTKQLARANGSLTRVLMPVLRTWRAAYSQSSA